MGPTSRNLEKTDVFLFLPLSTIKTLESILAEAVKGGERRQSRTDLGPTELNGLHCLDLAPSQPATLEHQWVQVPPPLQSEGQERAMEHISHDGALLPPDTLEKHRPGHAGPRRPRGHLGVLPHRAMRGP